MGPATPRPVKLETYLADLTDSRLVMLRDCPSQAARLEAMAAAGFPGARDLGRVLDLEGLFPPQRIVLLDSVIDAPRSFDIEAIYPEHPFFMTSHKLASMLTHATNGVYEVVEECERTGNLYPLAIAAHLASVINPAFAPIAFSLAEEHFPERAFLWREMRKMIHSGQRDAMDAVRSNMELLPWPVKYHLALQHRYDLVEQGFWAWTAPGTPIAAKKPCIHVYSRSSCDLVIALRRAEKLVEESLLVPGKDVS